MLVEYIRDKNRKPIGVVVALDRNRIGWSRCHSKLDTFDKVLDSFMGVFEELEPQPKIKRKKKIKLTNKQLMEELRKIANS